MIIEQNTFTKVSFRENILAVEQEMKDFVKDSKIKDGLPDCILTHYFTPMDETYGCGTYARQMFIPKGTIIIGKIHRHQHLNFIMQGEVDVLTEHGIKKYKAPCVFVSEVGLKRSVYAIEDTLWVTVHMTKHLGEENLSKMEEEVIAPTYKELKLIDSTEELFRLNVGDKS